MNRRRYPHKILVYEALGFLAIFGIIFLDEVFGFPERYLGDGGIPEWRELAVETVALVAIATTLILMTRRLVKRLFYLEKFLRVCAWCRRIQHEGEWSSLEDYFSSGFDTRTTHGMCPECFEKSMRASG